MLNSTLRRAIRSMSGMPPCVTAQGEECNRSVTSVDRAPIRHRSYRHCEQAVAALHLRKIEEGIGGCALLVGPSGAGKSLLQTQYEAWCSSDSIDLESVPILRAVIPSKPTVKSVVTELLHAANHPSYAIKESEALKTIRLMTLMKEQGTEVVILDEMNNVHDQANDNVEHELTDWLKNFIDSSGCLVVLCGLPRIDRLLRRNNQLRRRISGRTVMSELRMSPEENWREFREVLRELHRRTPVQAIRFDDQIVARRFYIASAGLMDYLIRIVNSAVQIAIRNGGPIDAPVLAAAFVDQVWPDCPAGLNPFLIRDPDELRMLTESGEPYADWGLQ